MRRYLFASLFFVCSIVSGADFHTSEAKAYAAALKSKKPVMIYFYGIWCPPCNELKELVFSHPDFIAKAKEFVLLQVDVDKPSSWKLKDKFTINGYPTILFTTPQKKIIYRFAGYRSPKQFLLAMNTVLNAKGKDLEQSCLASDIDSIWNCAFVCGENGDKECALKAYAKLEGKLPKESPRYQLAQMYAAENAETVELRRDAFERLINEFPASPMALVWALAYSETFAEEASAKPKRGLYEKVLVNWQTMQKDPRADDLGFSLTDMVQLRGQVVELLGDEAATKEAFKECAEVLDKTMAGLPKNTVPRGFTLERIFCLENAGEKEKALKLAQEYSARFPEEFTFHYQAASILNRLKRFPEAIPVAKKAFDASYGDNRIRAALLLVKLYATVPNKQAAKAVYDQVVAEIRPDQKLKVRTHRYLKMLKAEFEKL